MPNNNETYITGLRVVKGRKKSQCLNLSNARIKSYAEIEEMTEDELQGVIICPDYPLEDGHLVPSSAIGYEDGTVEDALDELNAEIDSLDNDVTIGERVSISPNETYKAPSDGYLALTSAAGYPTSAYLRNENNVNFAVHTCYNQSSGTSLSIYVRKGINIYVTYTSGQGTVNFTPITV